jgi:tetratricopeptide (TPR) repeat protein
MRRSLGILCISSLMTLASCATLTEQGTLAELSQVEADVEEVYLGDSLERAADSYRRYLAETTESARTPEAMRRLADLQIEEQYGLIGGQQAVATEQSGIAARAEMTAPDKARLSAATPSSAGEISGPMESQQDFERRATERDALLLATSSSLDSPINIETGESVPTGPREAIRTYQEILRTYPNYERNDQVLYQMSRAYDEVGQPDDAMDVMNRLVAEYPHSKYTDEVQFRRGEYFFVRKSFLDAEEAYASIVGTGTASSYYELALYKLGWTLYKQELYEEALNNYIAMLDYRQSIGYDFDAVDEENNEHRVVDTFRVISLSFSNLGGPNTVDNYFLQRGHRSYADKIYGNLGEFYLSKLRYDDAASVYKSFIALNPFHKVSPHFNMRVIDIYVEAGFPQLVVTAKKEFATTYALDTDYWQHFDIAESSEVIGFLKTNVTDLANHYHAIYQDENLPDEKSGSFTEAQRWYRQFLYSFPADVDSPVINYQLADLLLENADFGDAALEYERTAYDYAEHEQSSAAGYAAIFAHREDLKVATDEQLPVVQLATVDSSLRFADTFMMHEQAPVVLGAAADDLYEMKNFPVAIASAEKLIDRYPNTDVPLLRSAWTVIAHSSIDLAEYENAEHAYVNVLGLTEDDDEKKPAIIEGLAAAIYKQGEQADLVADYRGAANHFLRIKVVAPTSKIRTAAEYDGAAALMKLSDWTMASGVLEEFRESHPDHELNTEATKQLAYIYREDGQIERSAAEHERISAEAEDPEISREALLTAAELYDEVSVMDDAIRVYEQYVADYPRPLNIAMETRSRLADIFKSDSDYTRYFAMLNDIISVDQAAGAERTDRSRFLAAGAALVLAETTYERFAGLALTQPFEESLAEKQSRMDTALEAFENLVPYEVAEVTAAATYYIAEIYYEFSASLLGSERPAGLSSAEKIDYELVIEEEAYPFEDQAIAVHEENFELLAAGIYNAWVQKSLDKLGVLMPGRYAKSEISDGFVGSIDHYAYRMPIAPEPGLEGQENVDLVEPADAEPEIASTAQMRRDANTDLE